MWRHKHHHGFGHLSVGRTLFVGANTPTVVSTVVQLHTSLHVSSAAAHDTVVDASSATVKAKLRSAMLYNDCIFDRPHAFNLFSLSRLRPFSAELLYQLRNTPPCQPR